MISPVKIQENINGALQDLVTVSDIVDYGSNANGNYIRLINGIQICFAKVNVNASISPGANGLDASLTWTWLFPVQFNTIANLVALSGGWYKGGVGEGWVQVTANTISMANGRIYGWTPVEDQDIPVQLCAIGNWK